MSAGALFVYGTLRHGPLLATLAGPGDGAAQGQDAVLPGHAVDRQRDADLPMLVPRAGATAQGQLWRGLTTAQRRRLDAYELPFGYQARPVVAMDARGIPTRAEAYFPGPDLQPTAQAWQFGPWLARHAQVALLAAQELAAHDPPLEGADLLRQWPMIQSRAHARARGATSSAPARLRHAAQSGDVVLELARPLQGGFFKLAGLSLRHRRFDGTRSDPLLREVLIGADAALVLPYDPVRDRVLLVEQVRPAPAWRGDPNPWTLEPVAGIVDAGETPPDAAMRECAEEAQVVPRALERMFAIYASPGSTTDHFHCYLGLADLPDEHPRHGGLAAEAEDLRLHLLDLDEALALIDSGEANAAPLVAMLLWLARHRARLQDAAAAGGPTGRP